MKSHPPPKPTVSPLASAIVGLLAGLLIAGQPLAQDKSVTQDESPPLVIEEVYIFGTLDARKLPGSAARIDSEQIRLEVATDINQLLKTVPGTYIREEDGYGLRPNIGIRGATSERSSKITLMEDGVMIAPAPYSGPAAYYFPTTLRAHSIEVLKGAPLLRYGPQTTGGVVNVVSTPIPSVFGGELDLRVGENGERDLLANVGDTRGNWGWLLETVQRESDGFKRIDRGDRDAGFDMEDYVAKFTYDTTQHSLLLKAQYSEETSNETYLGLTDADFEADPDRRYGLSAPDQMVNDHLGLSARYAFMLSDAVTVSVLGYNNAFSRSWFRLTNGNIIIDAANAGSEIAQDAVDGTQDIFNLAYRDNAREYFSRGAELNIDWVLNDHTLALGGRSHRDEVDRFQPIDIYDQIDGELIFAESIEPQGLDNRIDGAEATSLWVTDRWTPNDRTIINLTLRHEDVETRREQFADPDRTSLQAETYNRSREWLPGASLTYEFVNDLTVLAGVHRGFSPLGGGAQSFEEPETSINYELGLRYDRGWFFEAIGFYSDFSNKTENCSNANPCSNGDINGAFTTGSATIQGVEMQASNVIMLGEWSAPLDLAYTYTDATLDEALEEDLQSGDELASIPEHSFSLRTGLEAPFGWGNYLVIKYIDDMCVDIGCNREDTDVERTDSLWVIDLLSRFALTERATVFAKFENLFDERAIVSREPDGARPNKPRTASVGIQYSF